MQIDDPILNEKLKDVLEKGAINLFPLYIVFFSGFTVLRIDELIKGEEALA